MNRTKAILNLFTIAIILFTCSCRDSKTGEEQGGSADSIKIACIGDSITQGRGGDSPTYSWRYPLWKKLIDAGVDFDLVGSTKIGFLSSPDWADYKGKPFDRDHEGHWGHRTDQIRDRLPTWLERYTLDIALIQLGTNDFDDANAVETTKAEMGEIIDILRKDNPNVTVFLGLPCQEWGPSPALGDAYRELAKEKTLPGSPVEIVVHDTGWISDPNQPGSHTVDWTHPNLSGDTKLAQAYLEALAPYLNIEITQKPPVVKIKTSAISGDVPLTVEFDAADSSDSDGQIVSFGWQFGDGANRAGGKKVAHTFSEPGQYEVLLGVTDNEGATGSSTITVTVN